MQATSQATFKEFSINGNHYTTQRLKPSVAIPLAMRLAKILGPGLAKAIPTEEDQKAGKKVNVGAIFEGLAPSLDENMVSRFISEILAPAAYQNQFLKGSFFDEHFTTHLEDLFPLVKECVEFQFGSFFKGLLSGQKAQAPAEEA